MKLGMVTYNMGKDMDCPQLIAFCKTVGLQGVELRTTHAHKVEPDLDKTQRAEVKKMFADGGIEIAGLGTTCEYHAKDPAVVKKNIDDSIVWAQLAADVGSPSIKVRPNGLRDDVPPEKTLEQIGLALRQVATFAEGIGVQVRLEVHGKETSLPPNTRKILDFANHGNLWVCWNSNSSDQDENGNIQANFDLLKHKIGQVHITEIGFPQYPWQQLFDNLKGIGFEGYCLAEIPFNPDPERFMKYYKMLFDLYTGNYKYPQA